MMMGTRGQEDVSILCEHMTTSITTVNSSQGHWTAFNMLIETETCLHVHRNQIHSLTLLLTQKSKSSILNQ